MNTTNHPRLLARIAGAFYLLITVCALFAYMHVRGQLIDTGDMARTADNIVANEQLFRIGFTAPVIVTMCNLPLGFILYELFKVVNPRLALLALVFIIASATLEAVNSYNYLAPLIAFTLPEYLNAFDPEQRQALARAPIRFWAYGFSVSLMFFGVFCALIGTLILKSKFLPWLLRRADGARRNSLLDRQPQAFPPMAGDSLHSADSPHRRKLARPVASRLWCERIEMAGAG